MEQSFVAWAKMRAHRLPKVKIGIGDDAAVIDACNSQDVGDRDLVVTTDSMMDGVHFVFNDVAGAAVGRKLVNVNLSDLAAMAACPEALFLSMCLPQTSARAVDVIAAEVFEGVCEAAQQHNVAIAGGDTNCWDGPLVLNMTAVGRVIGNRIWQRNQVQADDLIVVTGPLGGSLLGKHLTFEPRLDLSEKLRGFAGIHAAMDISDGLSVDLLRMCDASRCGGILELDKIPISDAAKLQSESSGKSVIEHALGDGEDFELLFAVEPSALPELRALAGDHNVHVCGAFTSRTGLWAKEGGKIRQLSSSGYVHGR